MPDIAPMAGADNPSIDSFYNELQQEINRAPKTNSIILVGDFNAKVRTGNEETKEIMGMHDIGERNEKGKRLPDVCCINSLAITNTWFKHEQEVDVGGTGWTYTQPYRLHYCQQKITGQCPFQSADIGSTDYDKYTTQAKGKESSNKEQKDQY